ncbi:MAG: hypothetical protein ACRD6X_20605 [Pyrinomonadaceae bacterium]
MEQLDRQCEKFLGGPTIPTSERPHVTINRKGMIFLNQKALSMMAARWPYIFTLSAQKI